MRELLDLEQGLDVVGEAGTREEAIKLVRRTEPDLTILDLNMKGCSGVEILSTLKDEDPSRRIVVLTVSDSGKDLTACIQARRGRVLPQGHGARGVPEVDPKGARGADRRGCVDACFPHDHASREDVLHA
ncbi:MAG: response regulator [Sutterella wadsworthensis]